MSQISIRAAAQADHAAIRAVELAAFGSNVEADLVEALRKSGDVVLELVAAQRDSIVGHVLFSRLMVASGDTRFAAVALAPLAVAPKQQNRGIGGLLIAEGHRLLEGQETLSIVLGEPSFYDRFGYTHDRAAGFDSDYQCEALQALAWGDAPSNGRLVYAAPFAAL